MAGSHRKAAAAGRRTTERQAVGTGSRTYFDVVRSLSSDPEVRKAVDETAKETARAQEDKRR